ncbi:ABC transporter substrate-binding protein [Albimonas pacifica]|uniref:Amino acid/amide ABC transporter substrate-binding protein, HAAT family n=1 Tax=Albimonas pacifica TaxID=1114924 RepID=A0A1I3BNW1_9RHOB|nr:ABC transporter substrate-binding protein [Albimonas pacifica]SFH63609.1 amino acid/amide ABC transporter substrate-binding protein, HAAT family [Albimonas pacifica]
MMNRRALLGGAAAGGAAGAALLSGLNTARAQDGETVHVGSALPLSGAAAADGIEFRNGLELAVTEINAAGGILGRPVELHVEDTGDMGASNTSQAMQRLIDRYETPVIVNGYNVGTSMVEMDVAADNDVLFTHYNTVISHNTKFLEDPERYYGSFQGDPPELYYGLNLLPYLNSLIEAGAWTPENRKIALIPSANEYSIVIANAVRDKAAEYGWEVSLYETVPFPNNQWGPVLAKLRQDPPAVIAVTHFLPQDLAQFMQQFVPQPTRSLVYMQYGPSLPAFREIGGDAVKGVLYSTTVACLPDDYAKGFRDAYLAAFGANSSPMTGSQTYDGLWKWALSAAIAGGPGAPFDKEQAQKIAAVQRKLVFRGVNGVCHVDPEGQSAFSYPAQTPDPSLGMPHQFLQHQDLTVPPILVGPALYANGEFLTPPWLG